MTTNNTLLTGSNNNLSWGEESDVTVQRKKTGELVISNDSFMPTVRNVPVFPSVTRKPGETWTAKGEEVHFDCYGMSAYLYGRFNNEAKIPCQVVGDSSHKVVMLDRGNGFVSTADDYRKYNLDYLFKWRNNQNTTVLLPAPGSNGSTSGGNTNSSNTNSGNGGSN